MRTLGRLVGRIIVSALGYVIACAAAGMAISLSVVLNAYLADTIGISNSRLTAETLIAGGIFASIAIVYAFAPAVIAVVVAEVFRVRRMIYFVLAGGLAGALAYVTPADIGPGYVARIGQSPADLGPHLLLYVAAGLIGGFVYWGFAGRTSGVLERPA